MRPSTRAWTSEADNSTQSFLQLPHHLTLSVNDSPARPRSRLGAAVNADSELPFYNVPNGSATLDEKPLTPRTGLFPNGFYDNEPRLIAAAPNTGVEYQIATRTKFVNLGCWFLLNLSLTLYNKALLSGFAFPWLLTALHTACASIGCYILMLRGVFKLTDLDQTKNLVLIAFSFLFTINIAISNVSLAAVSVPFHQIMRSTCPIFTILIYRIFYSRIYSTATYLSIIPIVVGVGLATYGDVYFTPTGFFLTLAGVVLASVKTVASNRLMTGPLALPPFELLLRMSPLAAVQSLIYAVITGETGRFLKFREEGQMSSSLWIALLGNGVIAFLLNVSSFQTNKVAGALTMTIGGNLKQCLTIILGIIVFSIQVSFVNGVGMVITVLGAAWYSKVELDSKGKR